MVTTTQGTIVFESHRLEKLPAFQSFLRNASSAYPLKTIPSFKARSDGSIEKGGDDRAEGARDYSGSKLSFFI